VLGLPVSLHGRRDYRVDVVVTVEDLCISGVGSGVTPVSDLFSCLGWTVVASLAGLLS
jgi:hypothetical protein